MTCNPRPPSFILSVIKLVQKLFWKRWSPRCVRQKQNVGLGNSDRTSLF